MAEGQLIMVLGMGRSGTSAIAKVLELCGGCLPAALMPANFANPSGYWEPEVAVAMNDAFMLRYGSSWYDPTMRLQAGDANVSDEAIEAFVAAIAAFLRASSGPAPLVIKDPRITALVPYWLAAANREGYSVAFVIAVREPGEVAQSLLARDRISREFSDILWLKYSLLAERGSRSGPRAVVPFASLLADWESEVERIGRALRLELMPRARKDEVDAFLSADLYHHRHGDAAPDRATLPLAERIFVELRNAAHGGPGAVPAYDAELGRYLACDRRVRADVSARLPPDAPANASDASIAEWDALGARIAAAVREAGPATPGR